MKSQLHDGWTVTVGASQGPGMVPDEVSAARVPATVPGCVHTDLLSADLIPDPYLDQNEDALAWIGRTPWTYRTQFDAAPVAEGERVDLVFEGLDTLGDVELNGEVLGRVANMHRTHRFDVTQVIQETNELVVRFAAQLTGTEQAEAKLGARSHTNHHPYNAVRKMACNFGWDWGPDLVTAGLWRPVTLHRWSTARLGDVLPHVTVSGSTGQVRICADVVGAHGRQGDCRIIATVAPADAPPVAGQPQHVTADVVASGSGQDVLELEVPDALLWWPRGYGAQHLYELTVVLLGPDGGELDRWEHRIGFRTITIDTAPDGWGEPFHVQVNDRPVYVKGANWIPDDCFPARLDRDSYRRSLTDAADAGLNLLRVWGGGLYEPGDFYELCDELGLMVWQDFLFACAAYAEEEPLRTEVLAEARENIVRLAPHASLILWNGNNENLWGHEDWEWAEQHNGRTWGAGYYCDLLPKLLNELDPTRPYCPGSPWSPGPGLHPNDPAHGTMHIWDVWNQRDYSAYRDYVPRFVSEFGYQGPPAWSTLTRAVHDDPLLPDSPAMLSHQKAIDGDGKLTRGITPHLPVPADIEEWHWAMQVQQARAVGFGLEHLRSWYPVCSGAVVWQLNDCWPVTSWAMVDGDGRRKPLWHSVRRSFAPRLVTVQPRGDGLAAAVCNDTDHPWQAYLPARRLRLDGAVLAESEVVVEVAPRSVEVATLPDALSRPDDERSELLVVGDDTERGLWFWAEDLDLDLEERWAEVRVEQREGGAAVHVTAASVIKDVCLLVDKVHPLATVDDGMVTLLPHESHSFVVESPEPFDPELLTAPRVLRSVNALVGSHSMPRSEQRASE